MTPASTMSLTRSTHEIFSKEIKNRPSKYYRMTAETCRQMLSGHLFWDVERENVDMKSHAAFVVQRVLEYGTISDWRLLRDFYGIALIVELCKTMRALDPICLSFISAISKTPIEEFRCYHTKQLTSTPWTS